MFPMEQVQGETWLASRLGTRLGVHAALAITAGDTTAEQRKERMRQTIKRAGLEPVSCGRRRSTGMRMTYSEAFELLYGEKL